MPIVTNDEQGRSELATLLASGIFSRAPSLAQILTYVCEKHFEGEADQIKEYNLAVEALGRPAHFDQKRDSIVRVEIHRLRRRLKEYYEGPGAGHAVRIEIPSGRYAPMFIYRDPEAALVPANHLEVLPPAPGGELENVDRPSLLPAATGPGPAWKTGSFFALVLAGLAILGSILAGVWLTRSRPLETASNVPKAGRATVALAADQVRILAGSSRPYVDRFGQYWEPDRWFQGGAIAADATRPIFGTRDPKLYQNRREGAFRYDIPLKPGVYELRLHLAETVYGDTNIAGGGESSRVFNVKINGKTLLDSADVIADAGPNTADIRVFKNVQPSSDGFLHLDFQPVTNLAILNALEITPGAVGKLNPIRITARDQPYTDKSGRMWGPDRFFRGGQQVLRPNAVLGAGEPEIFRGERFGNLTYAIPVADGRYTVNLYFAETWFGPDKPQKGGAGSRVFDVLCNGVAMARHLDVYKEVGGSDRLLAKSFRGVKANPQGKIVISFVPLRNYACVNAIEVLDESEK